MANAVYPKWLEAIAQAAANSSLAGSGATGLYAALVDTGTYTYSTAHEFYSSVASAQVGTEVELTSKTFTNGVIDAADPTFTSVTGNSAEAIVLFVKNAGANSTWRLFAYLDSNITGLPFTPNGGNVVVTWHSSGILAL